LLENENDLDTILAERTKPKPNISVNGLKLSEKAAHKPETEVQNVVAKVLERPPRTADWRTINTPLTHAYGLAWLEDTIKMEMKPRPGLPSDIVAIKLEAASHTDADGKVVPDFTYGKIILAWNYRRKTGVDTVSVNIGSTGVGPVKRIVKTGCDFTNTLIFAKQKFLWVMTDMYTLFIVGIPASR
jgi:hypothetical protein